MADLPSIKPKLIKRGKDARSVFENGKRKYGPFRIKIELQMSPLSVVSDTLEFYVYQETGEKALQTLNGNQGLITQWYRLDRQPYDGFPKPATGSQGYAIPISDEEFTMTWRQAEREGREVLKAGNQVDPMAFHIRPRNTRVIITG